MQTSAPRALPWLWIAIVAVASVALSFRLSCATPFAALATLAALNMRRADGLVMIAAAFGLNQLVGYGFLNYPHDLDSYAWGAAIGVAAIASYGVATVVAPRIEAYGQVVTAGVTLAAAFAAYEIVLLAATAILPSSELAFAPQIVGEIALVNALVYPGLILLARGADLLGLTGARVRA
jgi:hypothetical protein